MQRVGINIFESQLNSSKVRQPSNFFEKSDGFCGINYLFGKDLFHFFEESGFSLTEVCQGELVKEAKKTIS